MRVSLIPSLFGLALFASAQPAWACANAMQSEANRAPLLAMAAALGLIALFTGMYIYSRFKEHKLEREARRARFKDLDGELEGERGAS